MPAKTTSTASRRTARTRSAATERNAPTSASTTRTRNPARKTAARGRVRTAPNDAIALLRDDHRKVVAMFEQFGKMSADGPRKEALVARICQALTVHAKVEEDIFYPAARTVLDDVALIDEADVEHASARALIADLESMKSGDDHYDAKVTVLGEYVRHHVKEEQEEVFPRLRRSGLDLAVLGERVAARKRELAGVLSDPAAADEAMRSFIPIV